MITQLALSAPIPLSFQAFNYDAGLYVQAFLRDSNNNAIPGSPVQLTAGDNGLYTNNLVLMPSTAWVTAQYVVYEDAGYTTVSLTAGAGLDTFILVELLAGQALPTYVQLFDYNASKYVKAYVTDQSGNAVSGSPVMLPSIGPLGLYGSSILQVPTSGAANAQYIVYDDSYYTTISTSEGAGNDVIPIGASLFFLELGRLPNLKETLYEYQVPLTFIKIVKEVQQFKNVEFRTTIQFRGMWAPMSRKLDIQGRGQRSWKWYECYASAGLPLECDDVISYNATQYRVMEKMDYSLYGYELYRLTQDYTIIQTPQVNQFQTQRLLTQDGNIIDTEAGEKIIV